MTYFTHKPVLYTAVPSTPGYTAATHRVLWAFDDGTSAEGLSVRKVWETSGLHTAVASAQNIVTGGETTIDTATLLVEYAAAPSSAVYFRYSHTTSRLPNGSLLTTGGVGNYAPSSDSITPYNISVYDPVTGAPLSNQNVNTTQLAVSRASHINLPNGQTLLTGGGVGGQIYADGVLTNSGRYPTELESYGANHGAMMAYSRDLHTAHLLANGRAFLIGGVRFPGGGWDDIPRCTTMFYDLSQTTLDIDTPVYDGNGDLIPDAHPTIQGGFIQGPDMNYPRSNHCSVVLQDGKILVCGGNQDLSKDTYSWEPFHPNSGYLPGTEPNPWDPGGPRWYSPGTVLDPHPTQAENRAALGYTFNGFGSQSSAEIFNPGLNTWTVVAPMTYRRTRFTASLLPNGKVLVCGGYDKAYSTGGGSMIHPPGVGVVDHDADTYGYQFVGGTASEIYDPVANTWTTVAPMASRRFAHTATVLDDGRVLVCGGFALDIWLDEFGFHRYSGEYHEDQMPHLATSEIYNPDTNTWTAGPSMETPRVYHQATKMDDGNVYISGGLSGREFSHPGTGNTAEVLSSCEIYDVVGNVFYHSTPAFHMLPKGYQPGYNSCPHGRVVDVFADFAIGATAVLMPGNIPLYNGVNKLVIPKTDNYYMSVTEGLVTTNTPTQHWDVFVGVEYGTIGANGTDWWGADSPYLVVTNSPGAAVVLNYRYHYIQSSGYAPITYDYAGFYTGTINPGGISASTYNPSNGVGSVTVNPSAPTDYYLTVGYVNGAVNESRTVGPVSVIGTSALTLTPATFPDPSILTPTFLWGTGYIDPNYTPSPINDGLWHQGTMSSQAFPVTSGVSYPVTPRTTTTYTLLTMQGGRLIATSPARTVTVNLTASLSGTPSILPGDSGSLTARFPRGSGTITPGNIHVVDNVPVSVTPADTTLYTLTVTPPGGEGGSPVTTTWNMTVGITADLTADFTSFATPGDPITLTPTFPLGTGVITPGDLVVTSGVPIVVNPADTTLYTLTVDYLTYSTTALLNIVYTPVLPEIPLTYDSGTYAVTVGALDSFSNPSVFQPEANGLVPYSQLYSFSGLTGDVVSITLAMFGPGGVGLIPALTLADNAMAAISSASGASPGDGAQILDVVLPYDGTYYIEASQTEQDSAGYALQLTEATQTAYKAIYVQSTWAGAGFSGELGPGGPNGYGPVSPMGEYAGGEGYGQVYWSTALAGQSVSVNMDFTGSSSGTLIATGDYSGNEYGNTQGTGPLFFNFSPTADGVIWVLVGVAAGTYAGDLTVASGG